VVNASIYGKRLSTAVFYDLDIEMSWDAISIIHTVSQKNDTDVGYYNFNAHQPISLIFGTDIA